MVKLPIATTRTLTRSRRVKHKTKTVDGEDTSATVGPKTDDVEQNGQMMTTEVNGTSFTVKELDEPDPAWDAERLGEFARIENERLIWYEKRMAVHAYRLGKALTFRTSSLRSSTGIGADF